MVDQPVNLTPSGPPETVLAEEPADARHALKRALAEPESDRRSAVAAVVARWPRFLDAWAQLGDLARDDVEAYAAYRVGYQIRGKNGPGESPPQAAWHAARIVGSVTKDTTTALAGLAGGQGTEDVSSAVGIVRVTSDAYQQSIQDFLAVVGLVSLALALLNLLPVLPLDGGHIVMAILERIRGRSFSQLAYLRYSAVGLTLFAFLLYLGLRNDLFSGGS